MFNVPILFHQDTTDTCLPAATLSCTAPPLTILALLAAFSNDILDNAMQQACKVILFFECRHNSANGAIAPTLASSARITGSNRVWFYFFGVKCSFVFCLFRSSSCSLFYVKLIAYYGVNFFKFTQLPIHQTILPHNYQISKVGFLINNLVCFCHFMILSNRKEVCRVATF